MTVPNILSEYTFININSTNEGYENENKKLHFFRGLDSSGAGSYILQFQVVFKTSTSTKEHLLFYFRAGISPHPLVSNHFLFLAALWCRFFILSCTLHKKIKLDAFWSGLCIMVYWREAEFLT